MKIARAHTRNPCRLSQGRGPHSIELLPRFGRKTQHLEIGKLGWQHERGELREPARRLALARQIAVILELDFRAPHHVVVARHRQARRLEQRATTTWWGARKSSSSMT